MRRSAQSFSYGIGGTDLLVFGPLPEGSLLESMTFVWQSGSLCDLLAGIVSYRGVVSVAEITDAGQLFTDGLISFQGVVGAMNELPLMHRVAEGDCLAIYLTDTGSTAGLGSVWLRVVEVPRRRVSYRPRKRRRVRR